MPNISGLMTWCQKAYGGWTTTKPLEICRDTSLVSRLVTWLFVILFVITHLDLIFVIGYCFRKEKVKPFSRHIQPFFLKIRKCFKWVISNKMRFNLFSGFFFANYVSHQTFVPPHVCPSLGGDCHPWLSPYRSPWSISTCSSCSGYIFQSIFYLTPYQLSTHISSSCLK